MLDKRVHNTVTAVAALAIVMTAGLMQSSAQGRGRGQERWQAPQVIEAGTRVIVRTTRAIDERDQSGRVFGGVIDQDVRDDRGRLAIPRGAAAELIVRRVSRAELYLDLESISVNGQRYGVDATKRSIEADTHTGSTIGANRETAEHVGGGALIGSVIGAIVGGGKGAAIGAAAGAGVGAVTQIQVHGDVVRVPAESLVTFRLESPLTLGWIDPGHDRNGAHYHGDNQR